MEISDEIKAKVFSQYWGKSFQNGMGGKSALSFQDIQDISLGKIEAKLILKPLSDITDDDAIEVVKLQQEYKEDKIYILSFYIDDKNHGCLDCLIEYEGYKHDYWQPVYSPTFLYLQSKGYDLPYYLLGGKTLNEAGLAIYENEN